MNRKGFVSKLFAFGVITIIPKKWTNPYKKTLLLNCFIAGFRYYEGPLLLSSMRTGDLLELVREPENKYDECAIALKFKGLKIGFIPASENKILSRLIDKHLLELKAEIASLNPNANHYHQVNFDVYCQN